MQRLTGQHIAVPSVAERRTVLKAMHDLQGVNALLPGQRLEFGTKGVTVLFGENASGKSGYSRVLKQACRARARESVLPDVSGRTQSTAPPEASFEIEIAGRPDKVKWVQGSSPPEALADIAVFDDRCARVYIDEANEVAYIPYGLDVFPKLARVCKRLREQLHAEMEGVGEPAEPLVDVLSRVVGEGKPLARVDAETKTDQIEKAAVFTEDDSRKLAELTRHIAELTATDPRIRAQSRRRLKQRIDHLRRSLFGLKNAVCAKAIRKLRRAQSDASAAEEAARTASQRAFKGEPLQGTGGEAWRIMFESAERYSRSDAYPGRAFPVTGAGSRCVLCQQPLDPEAGDRLQRFRDFLQADTAKVASAKRLAFSAASRAVEELDFDLAAGDPGLLGDISELEPDSGPDVEQFTNSLRVRGESLSGACESGEWGAIADLSRDPGPMLSRISKRCLLEAETCEKAAREDQRSTLEREKVGLEVRKLLADHKISVLQHVMELRMRKRLQQCYDEADTTRITRTQSMLMEQVLTRELQEALRDELSALGVGYIHIKLNRSGAVGSTLHRVALDTSGSPHIGPSDVLSEGESRMVAIASFLAELRTARHGCGIIFDDPVSSLDHRWREQVARRLVKEGRVRQVIVFTHDIVFLFALRQEAVYQQVPITEQAVLRKDRSIGVTDPRLPWPAMGVQDRVSYLKSAMQDLGAIYRRGESDTYERQVGSFYGHLREAWERAVEESLFGGVLQRFRKEVRTQQLCGVTVTNEDYTTIFREMEKCSDRMTGHDEPLGSQPQAPTPDELSKDLETLSYYLEAIKSRRKITDRDRKELLKPPGVEGWPESVA
jgi:energy-coupling factor transporter ATP-binding protein EcfA2